MDVAARRAIDRETQLTSRLVEVEAEAEALRAEVARLRTHECWWWWVCRGEGDHLRGEGVR